VKSLDASVPVRLWKVESHLEQRTKTMETTLDTRLRDTAAELKQILCEQGESDKNIENGANNAPEFNQLEWEQRMKAIEGELSNMAEHNRHLALQVRSESSLRGLEDRIWVLEESKREEEESTQSRKAKRSGKVPQAVTNAPEGDVPKIMEIVEILEVMQASIERLHGGPPLAPSTNRPIPNSAAAQLAESRDKVKEMLQKLPGNSSDPALKASGRVQVNA